MPVDDEPISGGVVTVENGKILAVGKQSAAVGPLRDLGDVVLLPGLVNAHTHLEFSHLPQPLGEPGMALPDWIRLVLANRQRNDCNSAAAIAAGLRESRDCGVTSIADIATTAVSGNVTDDVPRRLAFHEAIGFSAARCESAFADVLQRSNVEHRSKNMTTTGFSPHAPYTVHPDLLERLVDEASKRRLPVAMHLAESEAELQLLAENSGPFRELLEERGMWDPSAIAPGTTPMDILRVLARAPRACVIHGNFLSEGDWNFLARERSTMSLVYCPRTHAYFQHPRYPLAQMLAAGVRVALGTDSRASNPDLSVLAEMRHVAAHHNIEPEQIIRMGTLSGAEAIGWDKIVGSITPGKWADLTAVPCEPQASNPAEAILFSNAQPTQV